MSKTAILHFSPLELYPPVQNFLRVLEAANCNDTIYVFTTGAVINELEKFRACRATIKIIRLGRSGQHLPGWQRLGTYLFFYFGSFLYLLCLAPKRILYYETISAFPAWLYRRFFNARVAILIHYHEYTSPAEYEKGMRLTRRFHRFEKWLYPVATWVSHTNRFRLRLFEKDIAPIAVANPQIVPNYPPASWFSRAKSDAATPVKIVYAGSLAMGTMYTRQFAEWVMNRQGMVSWHIYAYNISEEAGLFFRNLQSEWIVLKGGVDYTALPEILKKYDVGVILYTGHIPNYVYNAPNKLFEYLACGLDVWYPEVMKGMEPYQRFNSFPKVIAVDFTNLENFNVSRAVSKEGLAPAPEVFFCEAAFSSLASAFCNGYPNIEAADGAGR